MYDVFYNARRGQWFDYHLEKGERGQIVAASNFIPLWTRAYETSGPRRVDIRRVPIDFCYLLLRIFLFFIHFCVS